MPSRATTQIAREIQKPSACWSSASAGGVLSVLNAPTSQRDALDSPSDERSLDRRECTIKQLVPEERLLLAREHSGRPNFHAAFLGIRARAKPEKRG